MDLQERIGARLVAGACFFRVWAPHAQAVSVLLQKEPYWESSDQTIEHSLTRIGDYWSATVPDLRAGLLYRFRITCADGSVIEEIDPASRDVVSSSLTRSGDPDNHNGSVIVTSDPYSWARFDTPRFENFLIYQLHVGSFAGRGDGLDKSWALFADVERKFSYIREMGFNCIELLPIQEFAMDRSWGYNPASFFAPESSYGAPEHLTHFVDTAHRHGLAVIFDVVYNHAGPGDNVLWEFDGYARDGGIYFEGGQMTHWGRGPAWWKREVQDFFYQNARMYLEDYRADGLRFDVTTQINGEHLRLVVDRLRRDFPDKYLIAEHLPDDPWVIHTGRFCATWDADSHHECQRALAGQEALQKVRRFPRLEWLRQRLEPGQVHSRFARRHRRSGQWQCRGRADRLGQASSLSGRPARGARRLACAREVSPGVGAQCRHAGDADAVHGIGMPHGLAARRLGVLARRRRPARRSSLPVAHRR